MIKLILTSALVFLAIAGWGQSSGSSYTYGHYDTVFSKNRLSNYELKAFEVRGLNEYYRYVQTISLYDTIPNLQKNYCEDMEALFINSKTKVCDYVSGGQIEIVKLSQKVKSDTSYQSYTETLIEKGTKEFKLTANKDYKVTKQMLLVKQGRADIAITAEFILKQEKVKFDGESKLIWKVYLGEILCGD